jgi:hypothetical protein
MKTPDNISCKDYVKEKYGEEAVTLITTMLGAK